MLTYKQIPELSAELQVQVPRVQSLSEALNAMQSGALTTVGASGLLKVVVKTDRVEFVRYSADHLLTEAIEYTDTTKTTTSFTSRAELLTYVKGVLEVECLDDSKRTAFFIEDCGLLKSVTLGDLASSPLYKVGDGVRLAGVETEFNFEIFVQVPDVSGDTTVFTYLAYPIIFKVAYNAAGTDVSQRSWESVPVFINAKPGNGNGYAWVSRSALIETKITQLETRTEQYIGQLLVDTIVPVEKTLILEPIMQNGVVSGIRATDYSQGEYETTSTFTSNDIGGLFLPLGGGSTASIDWNAVFSYYGDSAIALYNQDTALLDGFLHFKRTGLSSNGVPFPIEHADLATQNYGFNPRNSVHILTFLLSPYSVNGVSKIKRMYKSTAQPVYIDIVKRVEVPISSQQLTSLDLTVADSRVVAGSASIDFVTIGFDSLPLLPTDFSVVYATNEFTATITNSAKVDAIQSLAKFRFANAPLGAVATISYKKR